MDDNFFAEVINMADLLNYFELVSKQDRKQEASKRGGYRPIAQQEPSETEKLIKDV